jgi:hypothetical protein
MPLRPRPTRPRRRRSRLLRSSRRLLHVPARVHLGRALLFRASVGPTPHGGTHEVPALTDRADRDRRHPRHCLPAEARSRCSGEAPRPADEGVPGRRGCDDTRRQARNARDSVEGWLGKFEARGGRLAAGPKGRLRPSACQRRAFVYTAVDILPGCLAMRIRQPSRYPPRRPRMPRT